MTIHDPLASTDSFIQDELRKRDGPSRRKRPRYPSEKKRITKTYDYSPETIKLHESMRAISDKMGASVRLSDVHMALLEYALSHYESGQLTFELEPDPRYKCLIW